MRPALAVLALLSIAAAPPRPAGPPKGKTGMFKYAYVAPKNPAHQALYERLQKMQFLERYTSAGASLRLPKPLMFRFAGCDGVSNAWYEPTDGSVTFCYEYLAELEATSAKAAVKAIDPEQAFEGASTFILLHETGHALFDLLKVPVLGREEDAADYMAAFLLLRAGEGIARRMLTGAAWMYLHDSRGRMPDDSDFSDVHALDSQRYYNVLCMAYGSSATKYASLVEKKYLPTARAEGCAEEFRQIAYAVKMLIDPSVDVELAASIRAARKARWEHTPANAAPAAPAAAEPAVQPK